MPNILPEQILTKSGAGSIIDMAGSGILLKPATVLRTASSGKGPAAKLPERVQKSYINADTAFKLAAGVPVAGMPQNVNGIPGTGAGPMPPNPNNIPGISEMLLWQELQSGKLTQAEIDQKLAEFYPGAQTDAQRAQLLKDLSELYGGPPKASANNSKFEYEWKGEHVTPEFLDKVLNISNELGMNPDDLMTIMAAESSLDPRANNRDKYGNLIAAGLIQFANGDNYGYTGDEILKMDALQQLDLVREHYITVFDMFGGDPRNMVDLYSLNFLPGAGGFGQDDNYIIAQNDGRYDWAYDGNSGDDNNSGLDNSHDGKITRGDLRRHLEQKRKEYLEAYR